MPRISFLSTSDFTLVWPTLDWAGLGWAECGRVPYLLPILLRASRGLLINAPFLPPWRRAGLGLAVFRSPTPNRGVPVGASDDGGRIRSDFPSKLSQAFFPLQLS